MASPFFFDTDEEAKRALIKEGKRLEKIAKKVWRQYEASYKPHKYVRKGKSFDSITLKTRVFRVDENTWGIEVTFKNRLAYHDSVIGEKHGKGHAIMLISSGWRVKKGRHKDVPRFGYYEGFDYIGKVVEEFNKGKHKGVELEVQWSGKYIKK